MAALIVVLIFKYALNAHAKPTAISGPKTQEQTIEKRRLGSFNFLFHYQSQNVTYSEWISLFTLCLAPLVVHLVANVPESVVLDGNPPRFVDYICHYNPTSVIWRYFAIIDARIRCRNWTPEDMAAANAHFWTKGRWDSSQKMRIRQRAHLYTPPRAYNAPARTHVDPLSGSAIKTVIATLQGMQAMYTLATVNSPQNAHLFDLNLSKIFQPLAILGLLRLPAAPWMPEHFMYDYRSTKAHTAALRTRTIEEETSIPMLPLDDKPHRANHDTEPTPSTMPNPVSETFHPASSIRGIFIRALYLLALLGLAVWTSMNLFPDSDHPTTVITVTGFTHALFYAFLIAATFLVFAYYSFTGNSTTTTIPCLQKTWYKVYTGVVFLGMVLFIALAALQSRKSWCGVWTTFPVMWEWGYVDWEPCPVECAKLGVVGRVWREGGCAV